MYHYCLCTFCLFTVIYHILFYWRQVALDQPASPRHSLPLLQDKSGKAVIYLWNNFFWCKLLRGVWWADMRLGLSIRTSSELNCSAGQLKSAVGGWRSQLFKYFWLTFNFDLDYIFPHTRKVRVEGEKKSLSRTFEKWISTVKAVTRWPPLLANSFAIPSWSQLSHPSLLKLRTCSTPFSRSPYSKCTRICLSIIFRGYIISFGQRE